jgi:hypothetical protein
MQKISKDVLGSLIEDDDPIIRWKANRFLIEETISDEEINMASEQLKTSSIIQQLLSDQKDDGYIHFHPYDKWFGAHWVLSILADLGYPERIEALKPMLEQCYGWLLSKEHQDSIRKINNRFRRCASQEGNCVFYSLALGLADDRTQELVDRLLKWQWEDGGWNCDKQPNANNSSFNETLIPLRGLVRFESITGDSKVRQAVIRAADVFLKRHLIRRIRDGQIIDRNFIQIHYPNYWHYDVLFALKVMAEAGFITDPRCSEGLDLLESKRTCDGGFPAEAKYYRVDDKKLSGHSRVDWGGTSKVRSNPFVTLDALVVLKRSGRIVF